MIKFKLKLESLEDVTDFCTKAERLDCDIDVLGGKYIVDGKSILGVCSLPLNQEVECKIYGDKSDVIDFLESIQIYLCENNRRKHLILRNGRGLCKL